MKRLKKICILLPVQIFLLPLCHTFKKLDIYFSLILLPQFIRMLQEVTEYNVLNAQYAQAGMLNKVSTELVSCPG